MHSIVSSLDHHPTGARVLYYPLPWVVGEQTNTGSLFLVLEFDSLNARCDIGYRRFRGHRWLVATVRCLLGKGLQELGDPLTLEDPRVIQRCVSPPRCA